MSKPLLRKTANSTHSVTPDSGGNLYVRVDVQDIHAIGNNITSVKVLHPAGYIGCPHENMQTFMVNSNESQYQRFASGFLNIMPADAPPLNPGESMHFTDGWYIKYGANSVQYISATTTSTAINGEFTGAMMNNRITELEANVNYLLTLVAQLQGHSHPNNGQAPTQTFTKPTMPSTLSKDAGYISNGNYLIGANAENYS